MEDMEYQTLMLLGTFQAMTGLAGEVLSLEEIDDEPYSDICPLCDELWFVAPMDKTTDEMTRDDYIEAFINHAEAHLHTRGGDGTLFGSPTNIL